MYRSLVIALMSAAVLLMGIGCTHVAPYEREHLSRSCMDRGDRDAAKNRFYAHVYDAREGAMGTTDNAGGGCGCN